MTKNDALVLFNEELTKKGVETFTEKDAIDILFDGITESEVIEAASDIASEEHTIKCENKFWEEHDWQLD
jgi:predicted nuclease of restriction endonuclease-like RecB superfamily